MDGDRVETVQKWSREKLTANGRLNNLCEVQQSFGFCNYYRRFVSKYSEKAEPLMRPIKQDDPIVWESEQQLAFETMVTAFTMAPVLRHFNHDREVMSEIDAIYYVSAGVLLKYDGDGVLHPGAYSAKKHSPAECNYEIYNKEHMAIIKALEEW